MIYIVVWWYNTGSKRIFEKRPFLTEGDIGLIKVVSEFLLAHPKCHFRAHKDGHFCQKWPFSGTEKMAMQCRNLEGVDHF